MPPRRAPVQEPQPASPKPAEVPIPTTPVNESVEDKTPNLAEAISLMTKELKHRDNTKASKAKSKEPDTFDGSDPRKLNNFILLCNLYFHNNLSYSDNDAKVTFTLSYLRDTALEYFEPALMDGRLVLLCMESPCSVWTS